MGKSLHMRIVAEGVETEEQLQSLRKLGCDLVQGYLIGKPGPLNSPEINNSPSNMGGFSLPEIAHIYFK
jgi:EAL domain-containing protein (putative c-di-GMP-specific phosphodiesterase class I)